MIKFGEFGKQTVFSYCRVFIAMQFGKERYCFATVNPIIFAVPLFSLVCVYHKLECYSSISNAVMIYQLLLCCDDIPVANMLS